MKMSPLLAALVVVSAAHAAPTGQPLASYPVQPCRVLDTRAGLGPVPHGVTLDVFVRGSALPTSDGALQTDCGVPNTAEAVVVNVVVVNPTAAGYLKANAHGEINSPNGAYNRLTFAAGDVISNEMQVGLCNAVFFDDAPPACPYGMGLYRDFQVQPVMSPGASAHVVVDVVGYLAFPVAP